VKQFVKVLCKRGVTVISSERFIKEVWFYPLNCLVNSPSNISNIEDTVFVVGPFDVSTIRDSLFLKDVKDTFSSADKLLKSTKSTCFVCDSLFNTINGWNDYTFYVSCCLVIY
jgi:hypothetical protein